MEEVTEFDAQRASWKVGSACLIFSRSKNKWFAGELVEIESNSPKHDEWLIVKYGDNKKQTKRIQRNCKDIAAMPTDHPSQICSGSKCKIYSDVTVSWCNGEVIEIFNDSEGEWLKVKYDEITVSRVCDIQRYSKDIVLIPDEEAEEAEKEEKELELFQDIKHILISEKALQARLKELGDEITQYYHDTTEPLICIGILNGGFMFCADLTRNIKRPHRVEFMRLKSYSGSKQADNVDILLDLSCDVQNKNILIVEDLIDTGKTMMWLVNHLKTKNAKSVKIACLLQKKTKRLRKNFKIKIDWIGFPSVVDEWLIGYGIDYNYHYRHLPYIASLKEEVYASDHD
eukprot:428672_1